MLRAVMIFDMFLPEPGFPGLIGAYSMRVRPLVQPKEEGFRVYDGNTRETPLYLEFPKDAANSIDVDAYTAPVGRVFIPFRGFANQFLYPGNNYNDAKAKIFGDNPSTGIPRIEPNTHSIPERRHRDHEGLVSFRRRLPGNNDLRSPIPDNRRQS